MMQIILETSVGVNLQFLFYLFSCRASVEIFLTKFLYQNHAKFLERIIQRRLQNLKILIRMVRGITVTKLSPTGNHFNKRMNSWLFCNTIVVLLERTLSLHLSPHISKNYSWYTELPLKLFLHIC